MKKKDLGIGEELERILADLHAKSKEPGYKAEYERRQREERQRDIDLLNGRSGIPKTFRGATFDNFVEREDVEGLDRAVRICRRYVDAWEDRQPGQGIALFGKIGVGKTHLAVAVAKGLIERYLLPVRYANVQHTFAMARWSFDTEGVNPIPKLILSPFLILDDLGSERPTAWTLEQVSDMLNYRLTEELPVIITSNALNWHGLLEMLTMQVKGDRESRDHLIMPIERAIDRLQDMVGDPIVLTGKSWRGRQSRAWLEEVQS